MIKSCTDSGVTCSLLCHPLPLVGLQKGLPLPSSWSPWYPPTWCQPIPSVCAVPENIIIPVTSVSYCADLSIKDIKNWGSNDRYKKICRWLWQLTVQSEKWINHSGQVSWMNDCCPRSTMQMNSASGFILNCCSHFLISTNNHITPVVTSNTKTTASQQINY